MNDDTTKYCKGCDRVLPTEAFNRHKRDGYQRRCKHCHSKQVMESRRKHETPESKAQRSAIESGRYHALSEAEKAQRIARNKAVLQNKPKRIENDRKRTERRLLYEQGLKQCFRCKEVKPLTQFNNIEKNTVDGKDGRCIACTRLIGRQWYQEHPESAKHAARVRRARMQNVAIRSFTVAQWHLLQRLYDYRCAYCGERSDKLTQDHVMPISRKGNHSISNIVPACSRCNTSKNDRTPEEAGMTFAIKVNVLAEMEQKELL
jgi:5-methylcytosine-specific restriction endonuclease McrA